MKIKKTLTLNIKKERKNIVCYDTATLQLVVGSSAVLGNYNMYGVVKKGTSFSIPIAKLKERLNILKHRKQKLNDRIELMEQIIK